MKKRSFSKKLGCFLNLFINFKTSFCIARFIALDWHTSSNKKSKAMKSCRAGFLDIFSLSDSGIFFIFARRVCKCLLGLKRYAGVLIVFKMQLLCACCVTQYARRISQRAQLFVCFAGGIFQNKNHRALKTLQNLKLPSDSTKQNGFDICRANF